MSSELIFLGIGILVGAVLSFPASVLLMRKTGG